MMYLQFLFTVIAVLSIVSNFFVFVIFIRKELLIKKPYNVFLLSLALTDMMTGMLMFVTPGAIFKDPVRIPNDHFFGSVYCRLLWSWWLLFGLGGVSVFTCLVLTVERWTAICRPFMYRTRFASKRLIGYVFLVWFVGLSSSSITFIEATYHSKTSNFTSPWCTMTPVIKGGLVGTASFISVMLKFFIPSAIILGLYYLAIVRIRESMKQFHQENHRSKAIKNVTKMAATASVALVACWLPNQIYFLLVKYRQVEIFTPFHKVTIGIVFFNSTLNPFIYSFWGKQFRAGMKKVLCFYSRHVGNNVTTINTGLEGNYQSQDNTCCTSVNEHKLPKINEDTKM